MFAKSRAHSAVREIFALAAETAILILPDPPPMYDPNVRFELLFLFFFLKDYREYHKLDPKMRELILDHFLDGVAKELSCDRAKVERLLYNERIDAYFSMMKEAVAARKVGAFLDLASDYIETLALYERAKSSCPTGSRAELQEIKKELPQDSLGSLAESISISISMHAQTLLTRST